VLKDNETRAANEADRARHPVSSENGIRCSLLSAQGFAGDQMIIFGNPSRPLAGAVELLAAHLHPTIEGQTNCEIGYSQRACILSSLVARDVLRGLDLPAEVAPMILRMQKRSRGHLVQELVVGDPSVPETPGAWNAHMVVLVNGFLLDFTVAQARRHAWSGLPTMLAAIVNRDGGSFADRFPRFLEVRDDEHEIEASWFHYPDKTDWPVAPDARPAFRKSAVRKLLNKCRRRGLGR
jgi:hypothetical protein